MWDGSQYNFMFWKKKNTIVVDAYTDRKEIFEAYQPMLARKYIPDWWKNLPQHRETDMPGYAKMPVATLRQCPAINDILKTGIIVPAWCQIHAKIDMGGNKEIHMVPEYTQALQHDERDFGHHKPDMVHLKITSRWAFVEKTGVKFVWVKPDWHHKNPLAYWTVPGIIEYKYQHGVLHNLMIPYNTKLQIDTGTPWLQLIPLSEKPIEVKCHLVSTQELEQIMNANAQISTTGGYLKKIKDIRKQQERLDEND